MRTASLILITTLFSATSLAAAPDWKTTLEILDTNIRSEIDLIQERIASLETGFQIRQSTVDSFTKSHRRFYETHCQLGKLNSNCTRWAKASTDRDLSGIREVLGLYELKDRLTWLARAQDFHRYAKVLQRPELKLEDTLTWKPARDVPTLVSPGQFVIKKPVAVVEVLPASGEQKPAQAAEGN